MPRFKAPELIRNKTYWDILKWKLQAQTVRWPKQIDYGPTDRPPVKVDGGALRVSYVNHATVLMQTQGLNIVVDPVWSDRVSPFQFMGPKRVHPPGIAWDDLPKLALVLITHSHYDHLDIPTIKKLVQRDDPILIVPSGVDRIIRRYAPKAKMVVIDWHQSHHYNSDLTVHCIPAQHWSSRGFGDRNKTLWCGYILDLPNGKIYMVGDTGYASGQIFRDVFSRFGTMRLALIPIGAYKPRWFMKDAHIDPDEAVQLFQDVHAQHAVATHWGSFQLSDEGIDEPVWDLQAALKKAGISLEMLRSLKPGQSWTID